MRDSKSKGIPKFQELIDKTFSVIQSLGGSATNDEIVNEVISIMQLPDSVVDLPHGENSNLSQLEYELAWARTYLKNFGAITNSTRGVWSIHQNFQKITSIDPKEVWDYTRKLFNTKSEKKGVVESPGKPAEIETDNLNDGEIASPDETKPWRIRLSDILHAMDPYGFERLSQRLLRECGFTDVKVTKKSNDGGIDGTGKLRINGIFSFNVAFQCKRFSGLVSAGDIRDFRGSLTTDIEKGVLITTGTFSKAAREEASNPGKQQIDLIDGEEFISKLAEFSIGIKEIRDYEIDESFFDTI